MKNLCIHAHPAQMLTFQLVENDNILINDTCTYEDAVRTTSEYLDKEFLENIFVIGETVFADKISTMLKDSFSHRVNIERIKNA